jgi:hypothetical protein
MNWRTALIVIRRTGWLFVEKLIHGNLRFEPDIGSGRLGEVEATEKIIGPGIALIEARKVEGFL